MTPRELYQTHKRSLGHIVATRGGQRISSGTGFIVGGKLVTCAHVLQLPEDVQIDVTFPDALIDGEPWRYTNLASTLPRQAFSPENSYDYTVLVPPDGYQVPAGLKFATDEPGVGEQVCGLGYPFEQKDLTISTGYVSSVYDSGIARIIKLDMSVNPSNSGGPLIRLSDGLVVGVIARKSTGLSEAFDQLIASFEENIEALRKIPQGMALMGVNFIEVTMVTQEQMRRISAELKRSAQVGIGHAIYVDPLRDEPCFNAL